MKPDRKRTEELAYCMKEIMEANFLRDPSLNRESSREITAIREELKSMGLYVTWEGILNIGNPTDPKLTVDITVHRVKKQ